MKTFLLTTLTLAALAVPAAAAQAAELPAQVQSNSATGMTYSGSNFSNKVTITLSGSTFLVDDSEPLKLNSGCVAVPGDVTKAKCAAVKNADGSFRTFTAFGQGGDDTITNSTPVSMIAFGGDDTDKLFGGPDADQLLGGDGDFDLVVGGGGNDNLSGGFGAHDAASYIDKGAPVHATLKDDVSTFGNGVQNESDTLQTDLEDLLGGSGGNTLQGDSGENTLVGGRAFDVLVGHTGADVLAGLGGDDVLLSNNELLGPLLDAAKDILNGGAGSDVCGGAPSEGDTKSRCES